MVKYRLYHCHSDVKNGYRLENVLGSLEAIENVNLLSLFGNFKSDLPGGRIAKGNAYNSLGATTLTI